jgi:hypothetical protein
MTDAQKDAYIKLLEDEVSRLKNLLTYVISRLPASEQDAARKAL